MADTAVHSFTQKSTPVATDEMYLVQSPFGAGDDRRATLANLGTFLAAGNLTTFIAIGGVTSSFPAIKRSGINIDFRLGDDTEYTQIGVSQIFFSTVGYIYGQGDGIFTLTNIEASGFDRLQFGGQTSAFPALVRSSTTLILKLADGSAGGTFECSALRIDATPSAIGTGTKTISNAADSTTNFGHYITINMNGTPYFIPASATAPT